MKSVTVVVWEQDGVDDFFFLFALSSSTSGRRRRARSRQCDIISCFRILQSSSSGLIYRLSKPRGAHMVLHCLWLMDKKLLFFSRHGNITCEPQFEVSPSLSVLVMFSYTSTSFASVCTLTNTSTLTKVDTFNL